MPADPRKDPRIEALASRLAGLEYKEFLKAIAGQSDDDLGWVRYHLKPSGEYDKPWQLIVINRWLERDKFSRAMLPQWIGIILATVLSLVGLIFAILSYVKQ
jgi:hypothetical protein